MRDHVTILPMSSDSPYTESFNSRFWKTVEVRDPDTCWPWLGSMCRDGYGFLVVHVGESESYGTRKPHRIAWELANGRIETPGGMRPLSVCHRCDNKRCCNPAHLFLGTNSDNAHDMWVKGRARPGRAIGTLNTAFKHPEKVLRGEKHGSAKITEAQVREIKEAYANGTSQTALSQIYGLHQAHISRIVRGACWTHLV